MRKAFIFFIKKLSEHRLDIHTRTHTHTKLSEYYSKVGLMHACLFIFLLCLSASSLIIRRDSVCYITCFSHSSFLSYLFYYYYYLMVFYHTHNKSCLPHQMPKNQIFLYETRNLNAIILNNKSAVNRNFDCSLN